MEEGKDKNKNQDAASQSDLTEIDACKKERDEYLDGWKRAKADFINYKKDEARRIEDALKFANEAILQELIAILDSFHLAIESHENKEETKGLLLIMSQLEESLRRFGLEKISVNPGDKFDPMTEEAIQEVSSERSPGTVHEEVGKGYKLYGRVVRPARVIISKGQAN